MIKSLYCIIGVVYFIIADHYVLITQNCQVLGFMIRCTQYEKPIPVPKDRFAFSFVLSQKKLA